MKKHDEARKIILANIAEWYVANNEGVLPVEIVRVPRPYKGRVEYFFEPPLPGKDNPVLIEEYLGDQWTLRIEKRLK